MGEMAEDRVYDDRREETVAYVASGQGVAAVRVASDRVGRFALAERCLARDVAAAGGRVAVATDEDVLAGPDPFEPLGFGPAVAVTVESKRGVRGILAAGEDGRVARYRAADESWETVGSVGEVRALERDLVAAADGVYRVFEGDLVHAGLDGARDVAANGAPLAATDGGLYRLGNGWLCEREGAFTTVAADADYHAADPSHALAHAATPTDLYAFHGEEWRPLDLPTDESVVDVAYGECVYAVTDRGTFLVDADPERTPDGTGGWRSRSLGLPDVTALAVA